MKVFDFLSGKIHIGWAGEFIHNLWLAEKSSVISSIVSDATTAASVAATSAAQTIVNSALSQASALYVGTDKNVTLLRKFAVEGQSVVLGGDNATQFVEGDESSKTDAVPQWDSQQGEMIESPMTIVFHPYIMYFGGEDDGLGWKTIDSIGTDNCAINDNVLTLNDATEIEAGMYVQLAISENSSNITKRYRITNVSSNDLTLSYTPSNVVSGSDVKLFTEISQ